MNMNDNNVLKPFGAIVCVVHENSWGMEMKETTITHLLSPMNRNVTNILFPISGNDFIWLFFFLHFQFSIIRLSCNFPPILWNNVVFCTRYGEWFFTSIFWGATQKVNTQHLQGLMDGLKSCYEFCLFIYFSDRVFIRHFFRDWIVFSIFNSLFTIYCRF